MKWLYEKRLDDCLKQIYYTDAKPWQLDNRINTG